MFPGNRGDLLDRLHGTDLVVRMHHGNQFGLRTHCALYIRRINDAGSIYRQECHSCAALLERLDSI